MTYDEFIFNYSTLKILAFVLRLEGSVIQIVKLYSVSEDNLRNGGEYVLSHSVISYCQYFGAFFEFYSYIVNV